MSDVDWTHFDHEREALTASLKASGPGSVVFTNDTDRPTLLEFLEGCLATDEELAYQVSEPFPLTDLATVTRGDSGPVVGLQIPPARLLAEVIAKCRIIEMLCAPTITADVAWPILCALALSYADRPGWDDDWRVPGWLE